MSEYSMSTDYIERKLGLCGHIVAVTIRFNKDQTKELILTTDKEIRPQSAGKVDPAGTQAKKAELEALGFTVLTPKEAKYCIIQ